MLAPPNQAGLFDNPPKRKSAARDVPLFSRPVEPRRDESVGVLTLGEAAARLGVGGYELEAMIAAGTIQALPTGYARMIPTREVERLLNTGRI